MKWLGGKQQAALPALIGLAALALAGCGGGGGGGGGEGAGGGDPGGGPGGGGFTLNASSPVDGAEQKADYPVVAVFSGPVDPASVDAGSFAVTAGVNEVTGSFRYSEDGELVIFTPDVDLVDGQSYTVTLDGITDSEGEALARARSWQFTARAVSDYDCAVGAPPASLELNSEQQAYYSQYADANGLPVLGGDQVSSAALSHACQTILGMMSLRQDLLAEMIDNGTLAAVTGDGEGITQIPAYSDLDTVFPLEGDTWDQRARGGLGATMARPVSSGTEENVLCYGNDPYQDPGRHEDIFIHEFAHSVDIMALRELNPAFGTALRAAYQNALDQGLFDNTYADDNVEEYWAEGVQSWFNSNLESDPPNGLHNSVNTRGELESYDPALYALISRIFPTDYDGGCPPT
ncbi:Ig-like domain-containing protein [Alloalcanivorax sp. C16-1]|uniref:Ig-like domain-containing protein n=1 Tax=Alloalcanivorax sp. C16-1 TaxID=3390051 RepID=UPI0039706291